MFILHLLGPHIGYEHAWPMSLLLQAMTTSDDEEIKESLNLVLLASKLGLIHESKSLGVAGKGSKATVGPH
jgi:meiotically up-regulated gene 157 (Mug157) protein